MLTHAVYEEGSFDVSDCSEQVKRTLEEFRKRQEKLKSDMLKSASGSIVSLFEAFLGAALKLQRSPGGGGAKLNIIMDTMLGDELYYFLISGDAKGGPAVSRLHGMMQNIAGVPLQRLPVQPKRSLLSIIPPSTLENMSERTLTMYMRLIEGFMWRNIVKDVCAGLRLTSVLLDRASSRAWQMERYGVVELSRRVSSRYAGSGSGSSGLAVLRDPSSIVKCPKNHSCHLHLTRHASFRCDLCGNGVERGKPMHGCRKCDWDACSSCTDKTEVGAAKWAYVKKLASQVEEKATALAEEDDGEPDEVDDDLQIMGEKLAQRDLNTLDELLNMLIDPGKITFYEFSTFLLPALHAALCPGKGGGGRGGREASVQASSTDTDRFHQRGGPKRKKLRRSASYQRRSAGKAKLKTCDRQRFLDEIFEKCVLGATDNCLSSSRGSRDDYDDDDDDDDDDDMVDHTTGMETDEERMKLADDVLAAGGGEFRVGDRVALRPSFVESRGVPAGPMGLSGEGIVVDLNPGRVFVEHQGQLWHYLKDSLRLVSRVGQGDIKKGHLRRAGRDRPELISVLHTILAFEERVAVRLNKSPEFSDLQSLIVPFQVRLRRAVTAEAAAATPPSSPSSARENSLPSFSCSDLRCTVHVEPLMPMLELQAHVLRTCRIKIPAYISFCRKLALDGAIIAERPFFAVNVDAAQTGGTKHIEKQLQQRVRFVAKGEDGVMWENRKIAKVIAYDHATGTHIVRYASRVHRGGGRDGGYGDFDDGCYAVGDQLDFNGGEARFVLAGRDYLVVARDYNQGSSEGTGLDSDTPICADDELLSPSRSKSEASGGRESDSSDVDLLLPVGTRVESNVDGQWQVYTILSGSIHQEAIPASKFQSRSQSQSDMSEDESEASNAVKITQTCKYNLVSEDSTFFANVPEKKLRGRDLSLRQELQMREQEIGESGHDPARNPMLTISRRPQEGISSIKPTGVIKRAWSALTDAQHMRPLQLLRQGASDGDKTEEEGVNLFVDVERPPKLGVEFSVDENLPTVVVESADMTLFHALENLRERRKNSGVSDGSNSVGGGCFKGNLNRTCDIFYDVVMLNDGRRSSTGGGGPSSSCGIPNSDQMTGDVNADRACIDRSFASVIKATSKMPFSNSEGMNQTCQWCVEVLSVLAELAATKISEDDAESPVSMFISKQLTQKLMDQLEDPLSVVSGALPDWCISIPTAAPHLFSHESRRILLERGTFGVSRAVFRQQESKVDVASLRSRMEAIRQRAVGLMQEAFSAEAEDPMALQLQADELYTLEESLKSQVASAFKRQRWAEHWLQSAKGLVSRKNLLCDAQKILSSYAINSSARRRRLEIQFSGESGFDAASGEQAGVTRGFYADVACELMNTSLKKGRGGGGEELVASEVVRGGRGADCSDSDGSMSSSWAVNMSNAEEDAEATGSLQFWISDLDPSGTVVLPTPRANANSLPGLFPLPVSPDSSDQLILRKNFRMLGRLFASALRDGFIVPLPLSCEFIALIQKCGDEDDQGEEEGNNDFCTAKPVGSTVSVNMDDADKLPSSSGTSCDDGDLILSSEDLPRPGFLGGEIYAFEAHICSELKKIAGSSMSAKKKSLAKSKLASDKSFARKALGKKYDCSFSDIVEGRTFVDPFDVSQSEGHELCPGGKDIDVNIDNIDEYVKLCKRWILQDGVLAQARSFRSGVSDFFPADSLSLLTPSELRKDICGEDSVREWTEDTIRGLFKLDGGRGAVEAMVAVAAIGGEGGVSLSRRFSSESPTFNFLITTLLDADVTHRRQFLVFVTSLPIVTPGPIEVQPVVSPTGEFLQVSDTNLPRANTCSRRLYLPKFDTLEQFKLTWNAIIESENEFKGFYEWQG